MDRGQVPAADTLRDDTLRDDRGSALLVVIVTAGLALMTVVAVLGRLAIEARAVEDSLAQTRAYWAAMGATTYVFSRTMRQGGSDNNSADNPRYAAQAKNYLDEIRDLRTWRYPDAGADYAFRFDMHADPSPDSNWAVRLRFHKFQATAGAPAALRTMATTHEVVLDYCPVSTATSPCTAAGFPGKGLPAQQRVVFLHRPVEGGGDPDD
ncbi:hypothetical protein [Zavarzinia sp. CC-PAN008]|uniref:hypothetical protein n=1 Tax=Zavarzinia sp. CC-PAN008 TaxID=3243332 RepID=UPI003F742C7E